MGKILFPLVIEELPQHIHGEKRVIIFRAEVINEPLEALDFIATVIFDKIKHTALVRIKRRGNVLQKKRSVRVNGQNTLHFFIRDPGNGFYQLSGFLGSVLQIINGKLPILNDGGIGILFHSCSHQLECNVFRQTDQAMGTDKPAVQLNKVLISLMEQALGNMGNQNKVEWVSLTDFTEFLEASQIASVVIEILREFVPDKHNGLQAVGLDHFSDPFAKSGDTKRQRFDLAFISNPENIVHDLCQGITGEAAQFSKNRFNVITTEKVGIGAGNQSVEITLVVCIRKPGDRCIAQSIAAFILDASIRQCLFNTLLNSEDKVVVASNGSRTITMDSEYATAVLNGLEAVAQVIIHVVSAEVFTSVRSICIQQLLQRQNGMGLAGAVGTFYPQTQFLLALQNIDGVFNQLYKGLVREELLPHIRVVCDNSLIDRRKIIRVNIKIMAIFLQHRHGSILLRKASAHLAMSSRYST